MYYIKTKRIRALFTGVRLQLPETLNRNGFLKTIENTISVNALINIENRMAAHKAAQRDSVSNMNVSQKNKHVNFSLFTNAQHIICDVIDKKTIPHIAFCL